MDLRLSRRFFHASAGPRVPLPYGSQPDHPVLALNGQELEARPSFAARMYSACSDKNSAKSKARTGK